MLIKITWAITTANEAKLSSTGVYEIWRSSDNNRANAVVVGTANKGARVLEDNVAAGTYYYWIRARNQMPKQNSRSSNALTNYFSSYFPVSATGGEAGSTTDVVD